METLITQLARFSKVVVTGPQRSGTTTAARILAEELGYEFIREEAFDFQCLDLFFRIVFEKDRFVIPASTLPLVAIISGKWR